MSLNKAIIQYAKTVQFVNQYYNWVAEATLYIPVEFLVCRQGSQVEQAYPETVEYLKKHFGISTVDQMLMSEGYVGEMNRDIRLQLEYLFKTMVDHLEDIWYRKSASVIPRELARCLGAVIMSYKDAGSFIMSGLHSIADIDRIMIRSIDDYLSSSHYFPA